MILPDDENAKPGNILVTPMSFADCAIAMTDGNFYRDLEKKNPNFNFKFVEECPVCGHESVFFPPSVSCIDKMTGLDASRPRKVSSNVKHWSLFPEADFIVECRDCRSIYCAKLPSDDLLEFLYTYFYKSQDMGIDRFKIKFKKFSTDSWLEGLTLEFGGGSGSLKSICEKYFNIDYNPVADIQGDIQNLSTAQIEEMRSLLPNRVVCCDLIEHIKRPQKIFEVASKVLEKGKLLFLNVGQMHELDTIDIVTQPPHLISFSPKAVEIMSSRNRFKMVWKSENELGNYVFEKE